jgi:raffinose/stachyose/melibiose transport system permease protein
VFRIKPSASPAATAADTVTHGGNDPLEDWRGQPDGPLVGPTRPSPIKRRRRRAQYVGYLYILPALIVFVAIVLVPVLQSIRYSFTNWDGISSPSWVGFANYAAIWSDPVMRQGLSNTAILVVFYAVLPIALGLTVSAIIGRRRMRGMSFYRTVLFLPQVISSVVVIVIWRLLLAPTGPVNQSLSAVGLGFIRQDWLGSYTITLEVLGLIGSWTIFGFCMVLFLAGMQSIPDELYDAAKVDGASPLREFFAVTLPGLRGPLAVAGTLAVIGAFQAFDIIYLVTQGGPGTTSVTPAINLYEQAFVNDDVGAASALGVVMLLASLIATLVIVRLVEGRRNAEPH